MGRYVRVWEVGGEEGFMGVEGVVGLTGVGHVRSVMWEA